MRWIDFPLHTYFEMYYTRSRFFNKSVPNMSPTTIYDIYFEKLYSPDIYILYNLTKSLNIFVLPVSVTFYNNVYYATLLEKL